jgi:MerR family mercuric resistance operon transcriptional regulator
MIHIVQTIGQLARTIGVPISTVRFYERRGLLSPDGRTASNYRNYTDATASRLRFIRSAQASGFSLADIREMLDLAHNDGPPCKEVAALIERRLSDVRQRVKDLRRVERTLTESLAACCKGGLDWCNAIERLKGPRAPACTIPPSKSPRP